MTHAQKMRIAVMICGVLLILIGAGDQLAPLHPVVLYVVQIAKITAVFAGMTCLYTAARNGGK